jgi:hypothetical protein
LLQIAIDASPMTGPVPNRHEETFGASAKIKDLRPPQEKMKTFLPIATGNERRRR